MDLRQCTAAHGDHADGRCAWCGNGLPPTRRRWCSLECSRAWAINHVWSRARAAALARTGGRCERCGSDDRVQVHHDPPVRARGGYKTGCAHHLVNLHPLCYFHHREAEDLLRNPEEPRQLALIAA